MSQGLEAAGFREVSAAVVTVAKPSCISPFGGRGEVFPYLPPQAHLPVPPPTPGPAVAPASPRPHSTPSCAPPWRQTSGRSATCRCGRAERPSPAERGWGSGGVREGRWAKVRGQVSQSSQQWTEDTWAISGCAGRTPLPGTEAPQSTGVLGRVSRLTSIQSRCQAAPAVMLSCTSTTSCAGEGMGGEGGKKVEAGGSGGRV